MHQIPESEISKQTSEFGFIRYFWRGRIPVSIADGEGMKDDEYKKISNIDSKFSLNHPNILRMYGFCPSLEKLITEVVSTTLNQIFTNEQQFSLDETISYMIDIINGLHFLENQGLVHNNLTPENIFLVQSPKCLKIGNFGAASHIKAQQK